MRILSVHFDDLTISANRQRKEFKPESLLELAGSITQSGLIHPVVVRKDEDGNIVLVAGERRVRAMEYIWNFGDKVRCGNMEFDENYIPCIDFGDLSPTEAFRIELEENIRRVDLTWQEKARATSELFELERLEAETAGLEAPTVSEFSEKINGDSSIQLPGDRQSVRTNLILARHLDNPLVQKAKTAPEALKLLQREEEANRNRELAETIGRSFTSSVHTLLRGNCLEIMQGMEGRFDVILTDPPYGINAQDFNDSGGKAGGGTDGSHFYEDSPESWFELMKAWAPLTWKVTKPQAHLYAFCDVDNFHKLKTLLTLEGWKVFRTPLIWINPTANRVPWIDQGPQRKYQMILYAVKGDRHVNRIFPDILTYASDPNPGHHAAKPVGLFTELLSRSCRPGDLALDAFAGSGPIFPAAHSLKIVATGIEEDANAYGIAAKRLEAIK